MSGTYPERNEFCAIFRGVRGTMPVPHPDFSRYGGNTSCVEVRCGQKRLILDAGTGITNIDRMSAGEDVLDILLSHTHIDHILGLMFLPDLYEKSAHIRVWAGHLKPEANLFNTLQRLISPPIFPIPLTSMPCKLETKDFSAGEPLHDPSWEAHGMTVSTLPLNHPDRATGYRIGCQGKSLCYITDIEHKPGLFEPALVEFIRNADLLIYDSTYDDDDFAKYQGWGHSTWQYAIELAKKAGVKQLSLFHHDPAANDIVLSNREKILKSAPLEVKVSADNMKIII